MEVEEEATHLGGGFFNDPPPQGVIGKRDVARRGPGEREPARLVPLVLDEGRGGLPAGLVPVGVVGVSGSPGGGVGAEEAVGGVVEAGRDGPAEEVGLGQAVAGAVVGVSEIEGDGAAALLAEELVGAVVGPGGAGPVEGEFGDAMADRIVGVGEDALGESVGADVFDADEPTRGVVGVSDAEAVGETASRKTRRTAGPWR
jgi:hypothetical protein